MKKRPFNTLFMLTSVDGKISTGDTDALDVDKDYPNIKGIKEGLYQYYDIEKTTDLCSLISGKVLAKIGINEKKDVTKKPTSFVVIDNKPHILEEGIRNCIKMSQKFFLVTSNKNHPAFNDEFSGKLEILYYPEKIDFIDMFEKLKTKYNIDYITIQTGGTLNSIFVRKGLIDELSLVIAPALIGGSNTSSLMDGESLHKTEDLKYIKTLTFKDCKKLKNSYLQLTYSVNN